MAFRFGNRRVASRLMGVPLCVRWKNSGARDVDHLQCDSYFSNLWPVQCGGFFWFSAFKWKETVLFVVSMQKSCLWLPTLNSIHAQRFFQECFFVLHYCDPAVFFFSSTIGSNNDKSKTRKDIRYWARCWRVLIGFWELLRTIATAQANECEISKSWNCDRNSVIDSVSHARSAVLASSQRNTCCAHDRAKPCTAVRIACSVLLTLLNPLIKYFNHLASSLGSARLGCVCLWCCIRDDVCAFIVRVCFVLRASLSASWRVCTMYVNFR